MDWDELEKNAKKDDRSAAQKENFENNRKRHSDEKQKRFDKGSKRVRR